MVGRTCLFDCFKEFVCFLLVRGCFTWFAVRDGRSKIKVDSYDLCLSIGELRDQMREKVASNGRSTIKVAFPIVVVIDCYDESVLNIRLPPIRFLHQAVKPISSF